jgi:ornithine--oxo-acid transaminase
MSSSALIELENQCGAHNYHPLPVVIATAQGCYVTDVEGQKYLDFLSGYSAVSQGHLHPTIVKAFMDQAQRCTLTARAFHNDQFPRFAEYITKLLGYDMVLPMNTGAEGVESALKLARRWGYVKKGILDNQALIVSANGCFHGRTIGVISMSTDPSAQRGFGPFVPGMIKIPYNDVDALRQVLETHGSQVAGFLVEPIQGEAGVIIPDPGYLRQCAELCQQHHVLLIVDEVQTGLARCGKLLCQEWDGVRGDIIILGKALSGGMMPISCILANRDIMLCIGPGEHGSTFGGNPLASATAVAALQVLVDEKLADRANEMGELLRRELQMIRSPHIKQIRGQGLLNAIEITPNSPMNAWDICMALKEKGLLTKPTHETSIRLAPPLIITREEILRAAQMIREVFASF